MSEELCLCDCDRNHPSDTTLCSWVPYRNGEPCLPCQFVNTLSGLTLST